MRVFLWLCLRTRASLSYFQKEATGKLRTGSSLSGPHLLYLEDWWKSNTNTMNPLRAPSHDGVWGKLPTSPALPSLRLCSSPQLYFVWLILSTNPFREKTSV
ncbi:hypothetical protein DPMN_002838 [Dreissena polymorpha]|uniref:Secreted protein n=1 Tax=Dreissena polymorpha TaxID=45954 RepID=A0A9D4MPH5_DREPO|nr:hypothetical protein DPMN_002838 [Dreissena polymorpha]